MFAERTFGCDPFQQVTGCGRVLRDPEKQRDAQGVAAFPHPSGDVFGKVRVGDDGFDDRDFFVAEQAPQSALGGVGVGGDSGPHLRVSTLGEPCQPLRWRVGGVRRIQGLHLGHRGLMGGSVQLGVLVPFVAVWATVRRMASVLRPRFVGYKRAMVLLAPGLFDFSRPAVPSPNTFRFGAVATALTYAVVDRAVCYAAQANQLLGSVVVDQADHDPAKVPVWECMCGFYALRSPREPASFRFPGSSTHPAQPSLLQVDLFGTVLEGERGFRASGQAVRSVTFAPRCGWCGAPTEKLGMGPSLPSGVHSAHLRYLEPLCSEHACSELYAPEVFQFRLGLPLSLDGDVASGVCSHAAELPDVARYFEEVKLLASQIEDHPGLLG